MSALTGTRAAIRFMNSSVPPDFAATRSRISLLLLSLTLILVLGFMFSASFKAGQAHFANDGPLGAQASRIYDLPGAFFGVWSDLYWVGSDSGSYTANFTGLLLWLLGPIYFNKFIVPFALLILGLASGLFFQQLRFKPPVCVLGGLAVALNSNFLSNACWGLSSRALSLAAMFLALAAVQSSFTGRPLVRIFKIVLAGLAIGLSVSEGGDNGAIFSLFFAAYVFWAGWHHSPPEEKPFGRVFKAGGKLAVMVAFAFLLASQIVDLFFGFSGRGIAGLDQKAMTKEQKWSFATQWSLPKAESLRVVVPGLFGYRLDTPGGGDYWGGVGQDPAYETTKQGFPRHSGAGEYAGVLVVLIAFWALAASLAKRPLLSPSLSSARSGGESARRAGEEATGVGGTIFTESERRMIWFWGMAALLGLLLSWGRHAPFYQFIYALPYFSTIRNPMKFMHPCHLALMILFAYGLQGMWRRYLEPVAAATTKGRPAVARAFEKKWMIGSAVAVAVSVLGFLIFASSQAALARHIGDAGFESQQAAEMARFSARETGWSVFFLAASVVAVLMISKGVFAGARARWAIVVLGVILVWDLARANGPWIQYYDYKEKYANNGVLEVLAKNAHEHRFLMPPLQGDRNFSVYQQIYQVEWLQHQFPYYNIQALDQPQESRKAADKQAYQEALGANFIRLWELTNTRFLGGMAGSFLDALNQQLDPVKKRFRLHTRFSFFQSPSGVIGARVEENGPFALVEFTGALPRAKLYTQWQVSTNEQATLAKLADPAFDPHQAVLVADSVPAPDASATNAAPGTVEFASYAPKRIELKAIASAPSVLLLNDKFDPGWKVSVDGKPATLLRCNFLMRGVQVPAGQHTVVFKYQPTSRIFYVSLGATLLGLALCGFVWRDGRRRGTAPAN